MVVTLESLRDAIVERIAQCMPVFKTVRSHGGGFDPAEAARYFDLAPAIFIVALGFGGIELQGRMPVAQARFAAFVMTTHVKPELRDRQMLVLVDHLTRLIMDEKWGLDDFGVQWADALTAENHYSGDLDKQRSAALWSIVWSQKYDMDGDISELADFTLFNTKFDLAAPDGQIDAEVNIKLEAPSNG